MIVQKKCPNYKLCRHTENIEEDEVMMCGTCELEMVENGKEPDKNIELKEGYVSGNAEGDWQDVR